MSTQLITFRNKQGHNLSARLDTPADKKPFTYALFAHCFTCDKNLNAVTNLTRSLNQNGIGVFRFDFTGLGNSEGEFSESNFGSNIDDLIDAAEFMSDQKMAPSILVGHSLGGAAGIFASNKIESIKAVATIATPSSPQHIKGFLKEEFEEMRIFGKATVDIGGKPFTLSSQFLDDLEKHDMHEELKSMHKALLILHSPQDSIVEIENATEIYVKANQPKSFITLDGADHLLTDQKDSLYAGEMIANWAMRYVNRPKEAVLQTDHQVISHIGPKTYITENASGNHSWLADEPVEEGGHDLGPTPYELLLSALGACTAITLRMYANHKKWDLQEVDVHLDHEKKHAVDSSGALKVAPKIDYLERNVVLKGDLDEDQRKRLMEIANKCPVHKTLNGPIEVVTKELR